MRAVCEPSQQFPSRGDVGVAFLLKALQQEVHDTLTEVETGPGLFKQAAVCVILGHEAVRECARIVTRQTSIELTHDQVWHRALIVHVGASLGA
jgi:hypothetical protein